MKFVSIFHRCFSYMPLLWVFCFTIFVSAFYLKLGRMPSYNSPDPSSLGFEQYHSALFWSYFTVLFLLLGWILSTAVLIYRKQKIRIYETLIFVVFYLLMFFLGRINPLGLDTWFMD